MLRRLIAIHTTKCRSWDALLSWTPYPPSSAPSDCQRAWKRATRRPFLTLSLSSMPDCKVAKFVVICCAIPKVKIALFVQMPLTPCSNHSRWYLDD